LGVDVSSVRRKLIFQVSILIGVCVSGAGMIGFIGLIVPHFARRMVGSMHGKLLPLAAIWGAASLTAADGLARMVARPYELPVGVVTALVGAPVFIWVILRKRARFA
jgi:iron complex transport system permease protein